LFVLLWGVRVRFDTCCTTDSPSYMTGSAPANFFKKKSNHEEKFYYSLRFKLEFIWLLYPKFDRMSYWKNCVNIVKFMSLFKNF
jgi:hypothetical protein